MCVGYWRICFDATYESVISLNWCRFFLPLTGYLMGSFLSKYITI